MSSHSVGDVDSQKLQKLLETARTFETARTYLNKTTHPKKRRTPEELEVFADIILGRKSGITGKLPLDAGRVSFTPLSAWITSPTDVTEPTGVYIQRCSKPMGSGNHNNNFAEAATSSAHDNNFAEAATSSTHDNNFAEAATSSTHDNNFAEAATSSTHDNSFAEITASSPSAAVADDLHTHIPEELAEADFENQYATQNSEQTDPDYHVDMKGQKAMFDQSISEQEEGIDLIPLHTVNAELDAHRQLTTWNMEYMTTKNPTGRDMTETLKHLTVDDEDYMPLNPEDPTEPPKMTDTNVTAKDSIRSNRADMIAKAQKAANDVVGGSLTSFQKRAAVKKAKNKSKKRQAASSRPTDTVTQRGDVSNLFEWNQATEDNAIPGSGHDSATTSRNRRRLATASLLVRLHLMKAAYKSQQKDDEEGGQPTPPAA